MEPIDCIAQVVAENAKISLKSVTAFWKIHNHIDRNAQRCTFMCANNGVDRKCHCYFFPHAKPSLCTPLVHVFPQTRGEKCVAACIETWIVVADLNFIFDLHQRSALVWGWLKNFEQSKMGSLENFEGWRGDKERQKMLSQNKHWDVWVEFVLQRTARFTSCKPFKWEGSQNAIQLPSGDAWNGLKSTFARRTPCVEKQRKKVKQVEWIVFLDVAVHILACAIFSSRHERLKWQSREVYRFCSLLLDVKWTCLRKARKINILFSFFVFVWHWLTGEEK